MALFRLPKGAEELLRIDPGYERLAVICRPDCVWTDDSFAVLEVNSDSPAMMTFVDYLERITWSLFPSIGFDVIAQLPANRTLALYRALVHCYREWGGSGAPTIALVDWSDVKTLHEQRLTAREFERFGSTCITCDPRELKLENGRLTAKGHVIDVVYRRVLFMDFLRRPEELAPLVSAYRDHKVCMVNPLRSFVLGNKLLLALLHQPDVMRGLSPRNASLAGDLIAHTVHLNSSTMEMVRKHRKELVLKGAFGYGGKEVVIGKDHDQAHWEGLLDSTEGQSWIAQRFQAPPELSVPIFENGKATFETRWANWSPWLFDGRFAGGMTRMSASTIVSITQRGALLPSISMEERAAMEDRVAM